MCMSPVSIELQVPDTIKQHRNRLLSVFGTDNEPTDTYQKNELESRLCKSPSTGVIWEAGWEIQNGSEEEMCMT